MLEDYKNAVISDYHQKKGEKLFPSNLLHPTPARLRDECLLVLNAKTQKKDEKIIKDFFNLGVDSNDYSHSIRRFDVDKLRPLVKFLKNQIEDTGGKNIELLAWLINFEPRPYNYRIDYRVNQGVKATDEAQEKVATGTEEEVPGKGSEETLKEITDKSSETSNETSEETRKKVPEESLEKAPEGAIKQVPEDNSDQKEEDPKSGTQEEKDSNDKMKSNDDDEVGDSDKTNDNDKTRDKETKPVKPLTKYAVDIVVLLILLVSGVCLSMSNSKYERNAKVFICTSRVAKKYHLNPNCHGLNNCKSKIISTTIAEAKQDNKTLCEIED